MGKLWKPVAVALAVAMAVAGCSDSDDGGPSRIVRLGKGPSNVELIGAALETFDGCGELLQGVQRTALELVGPYGLQGGFHEVGMELFSEQDGALGGAPAAPSAAAGAETESAQRTAGVDYSTTNVQEAGIDEPDIVKTDGDMLLAVAGNELQVVDVTGDDPRLAATVALPEGGSHQLLLDGDRAIVLTSGGGGFGPAPGGAADLSRPAIEAMATLVTVVDVTDIDAPEAVATVTLDGSLLASRLVDGTARLVLQTSPTGVSFTTPDGPGVAREQEAQQANKEIIEASTVGDWLPGYRMVEQDGGDEVASSGELTPCEQVHLTEQPAGVGTITILSLDGDDPTPSQGVSVLADGSTVYASADRVYVATSTWFGGLRPVNVDAIEPAPPGAPLPPGPVEEPTTDVHAFDISDPALARYIGSGSVPGRLLNQFSMSAHEGVLRVASTLFPTTSDGTSQSMVVTLAEQDGGLVEVGRVGDLGRGEQIYAVRFMGEIGYVVTFRQTDPLYVVDLSDPTAPRVLGELKINGYSAYLHPIGDGLLLGVGQDATDEGRVTGLQLSVFDVTDPARPQRLHQHVVTDANAEAEYDHHAFLHWPATGLTVLPVMRYAEEEPFVGAIGFEVDPADGIAELGRLSHAGRDGTGRDPWGGQIRRSLVIDDRVFTVSDVGLLASDLDDLDDSAWLAF